MELKIGNGNSQELVDRENELYALQKEIEDCEDKEKLKELRKKESHLVNDIQSLEDVVGTRPVTNGRPNMRWDRISYPLK